MSWTIIPRSEFISADYVTLPLGNSSEGITFVSSFLASDSMESDLVPFSTANVGKLRRAIIKLSGIELKMRTKDKSGAKLDRPAPILDSAAFLRASDSLGVAINTHATLRDGENVIEYVSLARK